MITYGALALKEFDGNLLPTNKERRGFKQSQNTFLMRNTVVSIALSCIQRKGLIFKMYFYVTFFGKY